MPEPLAALDAVVQEHRRCGDLDGGLDGRARLASVLVRCAVGSSAYRTPSTGTSVTRPSAAATG